MAILRRRRPQVAHARRVGRRWSRRALGQLGVLLGEQLEQRRGSRRRTCLRSNGIRRWRRSACAVSLVGLLDELGDADGPSARPRRERLAERGCSRSPSAGRVGSMPIVTSSAVAGRPRRPPRRPRRKAATSVMTWSAANEPMHRLGVARARGCAAARPMAGHRVARRGLGQRASSRAEHRAAGRARPRRCARAGDDEDAVAGERLEPVVGRAGAACCPRPGQVVQELRVSPARDSGQRRVPAPTGRDDRPEPIDARHGQRVCRPARVRLIRSPAWSARSPRPARAAVSRCRGACSPASPTAATPAPTTTSPTRGAASRVASRQLGAGGRTARGRREPLRAGP